MTRRYLDKNQLSGPIPAEISDLSHLRYLYLESNHFSGEIPATFASLTSLADLCVKRGLRLGCFPPGASLTDGPALRCSDLSFNALTGSTEPLAKLSKMAALSLHHNQFNGTFSFVAPRLQSLCGQRVLPCGAVLGVAHAPFAAGTSTTTTLPPSPKACATPTSLWAAATWRATNSSARSAPCRPSATLPAPPPHPPLRGLPSRRESRALLAVSQSTKKESMLRQRNYTSCIGFFGLGFGSSLPRFPLK